MIQLHPGYEAEHARLMALRRRLQRLPSEPGKVIYAQTGETYAQRWAKLTTDAAQRSFLLERGVKVTANHEDISIC